MTTTTMVIRPHTSDTRNDQPGLTYTGDPVISQPESLATGAEEGPWCVAAVVLTGVVGRHSAFVNVCNSKIWNDHVHSSKSATVKYETTMCILRSLQQWNIKRPCAFFEVCNSEIWIDHVHSSMSATVKYETSANLYSLDYKYLSLPVLGRSLC
jgi:hypothetical protein